MKKIALASIALAMSAQAGISPKSHTHAESVPGEILVKFKKGKRVSFLTKKSLSPLAVEQFDVSFGEFATLKFSEKANMQELLNKLNNDAAVEYAEPNFIYRAIESEKSIYDILENGNSIEYFTRNTPTDPMFGKLWGLENTGDNEPAGSRGNSSSSGKAGADVNALAAWDITKGSRAVRIAVIDTGVDYNHPDLVNNMWVNTAEQNGEPGVDDDGNGYVDDIYGYDFANDDGDPVDGHSHGTHCAGTIAAEHDNGIGVAGVMADAEIVAVKFLTDSGSGSTANAIRSIDYATKMNVDIMSNSWGGGGRSQALEEAIQRASEAGIVFTAAAGNSATNNDNKPHYPSSYDVENVISVAAHNYNDQLASFSCYGKNTVHVAAPGRNILSTVKNGGYEVYSGTSMATPHVSGVVGLYIAHHGRKDVAELRQTLMETSVYGRAYGKKTIGGGRVDAYNFLNHAVQDRPAEPNPNDWISYAAQWESQHPYASNESKLKTITVPGAKHVRVVVKKYEIEKGYDALKVLNGDSEIVDRVDGDGENYISDYVDGDTIQLNFTSDGSYQYWGFQIEEVQYIPQ